VGQRAAQLTHDDLSGLPRSRARPRSDAAARCENTHRPTVFDRAAAALTRNGFLTLRWLARLVVLCCAALLTTACARVVGGSAVTTFSAADRDVQGVNVDAVLLDQSRMQPCCPHNRVPIAAMRSIETSTAKSRSIV
jgi:hypothetical protein